MWPEIAARKKYFTGNSFHFLFENIISVQQKSPLFLYPVIHFLKDISFICTYKLEKIFCLKFYCATTSYIYTSCTALFHYFSGQRYLSVDLLDDNGKFHISSFFLILKSRVKTCTVLLETGSLARMRNGQIWERVVKKEKYCFGIFSVFISCNKCLSIWLE
jgi:hypothetical protein